MSITISVGAKRYDGGSGSAVFTGAIPLKPGQLVEANLATVALWDGGTEIGCTASALWPQHPDGSVKIVRVSTTLTLNVGVQKNLSLILGVTRQVSGPTEPVINAAWMKNPRLIGCTDAAHLCSSRVAPLPLVPIPHPNLPAQWNAFLTTEWDDANNSFPSWGRHEPSVMNDTLPNPLGGTANYDMGYPVYCKYLTSGNLDRLWKAHHLMQYVGGRPTAVRQETYGAPSASAPGFQNQQSAVVFYGENFDGHTTGELFPTLHEPWTDLPFQPIATTEWNSGVFHDLFLCYCLSGWEQARGTLLQYSLKSYQGTATTGFPLPTNDRYNYTGRFDFRLWRGNDNLYALLSPPMALFWHYVYGRYRTVPSPRLSKSRAAHVQWLVKNHCDTYMQANYSRMYPTNHRLYDSWWCWPGANPQVGQNLAGFPHFHLLYQSLNVAMIYQNFSQDARIPTYFIKSAAILRQNILGPQTLTAADQPIPRTRQAYRIPYSDTSSETPNSGSALAPHGGVDPWNLGTLRLYFVLAYQLTGDTFYRDVADLHASKYAFCLTVGWRAGSAGSKELGECWLTAFHAAAYRAGVPFGGWDLGETVNLTNLTGATQLALNTSKPALNLSPTIPLESATDLRFETASPLLGPALGGPPDSSPGERLPVFRIAILVTRTPLPKALGLRSSSEFQFETAGMLTANPNISSETVLQFGTFGRLQVPTITETFTVADTASGISADQTWALLLGTAFKIKTNMAVVENSPPFNTCLARLESASLSTSDFNVVMQIGEWLISGSDAWLGVGGFNAAAATGYGAHLSWDGSAHKVSIWKWVAGVATQITPGVVVNAPVPDNTSLRVRRIASTGVITVFYGGVQVDEVTDTAIIASLTQPGLWAGMGPVPATCRLGATLITADIA